MLDGLVLHGKGSNNDNPARSGHRPLHQLL